jgi:hypothetical protein
MKPEIKLIAKTIDSKFDYSNIVSFGGNFLDEELGEKFASEFSSFFSNEWHGALGDAIMDIDLPNLISRAVRHAFITCEIEHIDSGDYEVE